MLSIILHNRGFHLALNSRFATNASHFDRLGAWQFDLSMRVGCVLVLDAAY